MKEKLKINLPHTLEVWEGSDYSGDRSVAGDERERILIGSEVKPVKIAEKKEPFEGNGTFEDRTWYLIVQNKKPIIVEQKIEYETYGYDIKQEHWEWVAYELPAAIKRENLVINEE